MPDDLTPAELANEEAPAKTEAPETPDPQAAPADESLQAALTAERQARVTLEAQLTQFKTGLAQALGIEEAKATPEQLAEQLAAAQAETATSRVQLALYKAAPAGVDVAALLDSASFTRSLAGVDPDDAETIATKVNTFVEANPRFRTTMPGAGLHDAHANDASGPSTPPDINKLLRAAAGR